MSSITRRAAGRRPGPGNPDGSTTELGATTTSDLEPIGQTSYDRLVAVVYVGDVNVNEALVKSGDAWAARKYLRKRSESSWRAYENAARQMRRGLWSQRPEEWIDPREGYNRKKRHYKYKDYMCRNDCEVHCGHRQTLSRMNTIAWVPS